MKRFALAVLFVVMMAGVALGAGTITESSRLDSPNAASVMSSITITYVGDASGGTVPSLSVPINGFVYSIEAGTGAVQPTALYDITLTRAVGTDSTDVLGGAGMNLSQAGGETRYPLAQDGVTIIPAFVRGAATLNITGTTVNSATGTVVINVIR